jgi:membrane protein DedA with SNARE-associated domain
MFSAIAAFFMDRFKDMGYTGIIVLMTIESSFIPFPSEIVIPPAAYLASKGDMNLFLVILSGVVGSIMGALINYFLALFLGRAVIYKLADTKIMHLMMIDRKKIEQSEEYFRKYGNMSTFIGRLIPAVRQLISIPAGLAKMNMKMFLFYTALGSAIWNTILALLGYYFGENEQLFKQYYSEIKYILIFLFASLLLFLAFKAYKKKKKKQINE